MNSLLFNNNKGNRKDWKKTNFFTFVSPWEYHVIPSHETEYDMSPLLDRTTESSTALHIVRKRRLRLRQEDKTQLTEKTLNRNQKKSKQQSQDRLDRNVPTSDKILSSSSPRYRYVLHLKIAIPWLPGIHYEKEELEPYRLVGDVELDRIFYLLSLSSNTNQNDISLLGRFDDIIVALNQIVKKQDCIQTLATTSASTTSTTIRKLNEVETALLDFYHRYYYQVEYHSINSVHESSIQKKEMNKDTCTLNINNRSQHHHHCHHPDCNTPIEETMVWASTQWDTIQRGIDVCITYMPVVAMSLYYLSLVPGFSIPKINKVLQATRYLAPPSSFEKVQSRLIDTGAFIAFILVPDEERNCDSATSPTTRVLLPASNLRPGRKGWKMALRVRALHAKVRHSLLYPSKNLNTTWDVSTYGVPINQEDLAATLLAFSYNVILGIEFVAGISLSNKEREDYLALWRYIGWLLGVDTVTLDPCSTLTPSNRRHSVNAPTSIHDDSKGPDMAPNSHDEHGHPMDPATFHPKILLESILCHIMHPDESSVSIAHHLLRIGRRKNEVSHLKVGRKEEEGVSKNSITFAFLYRGLMCRRFVYDPLADALQLPHHVVNRSIKMQIAYMLTTLMLVTLRLYMRCIMSFPWFRQKAYQWHLHGLRKFSSSWESEHSRRMKEANDQPMNATETDAMWNDLRNRDKDVLSSCVKKNAVRGISRGQLDSPCPFAFIMTPDQFSTVG